MERPLLNDQGEYPSDAVLAKYLGKSKAAWDGFAARIAADFADASLEWRYYNDGKAWLCKLVRKKKTVCWVSVWDRHFRTTFYFTVKSDKDIEALPVAPELKARYRAHDAIGKLKPFTIEVKTKKALEDVFALVEFKSGLK